MRTWSLSASSRSSALAASSEAGTTTWNSRLRPSLTVSLTCIPRVFVLGWEAAGLLVGAWCGRRDLNPHDLRHGNLNPARLPVPPRPPEGFVQAAMAERRGLYHVHLGGTNKIAGSLTFRRPPG